MELRGFFVKNYFKNFCLCGFLNQNCRLVNYYIELIDYLFLVLWKQFLEIETPLDQKIKIRMGKLLKHCKGCCKKQQIRLGLIKLEPLTDAQIFQQDTQLQLFCDMSVSDLIMNTRNQLIEPSKSYTEKRQKEIYLGLIAGIKFFGKYKEFHDEHQPKLILEKNQKINQIIGFKSSIPTRYHCYACEMCFRNVKQRYFYLTYQEVYRVLLETKEKFASQLQKNQRKSQINISYFPQQFCCQICCNQKDKKYFNKVLDCLISAKPFLQQLPERAYKFIRKLSVLEYESFLITMVLALQQIYQTQKIIITYKVDMKPPYIPYVLAMSELKEQDRKRKLTKRQVRQKKKQVNSKFSDQQIGKCQLNEQPKLQKKESLLEDNRKISQKIIIKTAGKIVNPPHSHDL